MWAWETPEKQRKWLFPRDQASQDLLFCSSCLLWSGIILSSQAQKKIEAATNNLGVASWTLSVRTKPLGFRTRVCLWEEVGGIYAEEEGDYLLRGAASFDRTTEKIKQTNKQQLLQKYSSTPHPWLGWWNYHVLCLHAYGKSPYCSGKGEIWIEEEERTTGYALKQMS